MFISGIFLGWGNLPPKKLTTPPPKKTAAKLCALSLFFGRGSESQIYHGNFLLIDNKHRKLFVIMQPKGCKFMRKMHQNMFSGRQTYFWCIFSIKLHPSNCLMTNNFLCLLFIRRVSAIYLYSLSRPKERFIGLTQFRILFWGGSPQDAWNKHPERRDVVQTPITSICCRLAAVNLSCCAFRLVDNHVQCCSVGRPIRCTTN